MEGLQNNQAAFDPSDPKYKRVEDLPESERGNYVNVDGGFITKSATRVDKQANFIAESQVLDYVTQPGDPMHTIATAEQKIKDFELQGEINKLRKALIEEFGHDEENARSYKKAMNEATDPGEKGYYRDKAEYFNGRSDKL